MPITSQIKKYPFEIEVVINDIPGAILRDKVRSLDWKERKASKIITLDKETLDNALSKLQLLID